MNIREEYAIRIHSCLKNAQRVCIESLLKSDGMLIARCPFCGDSVKNKNKGHLYIKVRPNDDEIPWYKCHRCGSGGLIDAYFLELMLVYDDEIIGLGKEIRTDMTKKFGATGLRYNKKKDAIKLLPPLNNEYTKMKLRYLNNRLGIKLTQEDLYQYKIVLNLKDFLKYNNINSFTRHQKIIDDLDELYVGFLSADNEFINFRIIDNKLITNYRQRYINYNIFDSHENTKRFIIMKDKVNIMKDIDIISCEGPMDLIGIHQHLYNKENKNKIFVANMGMSAESVMLYLIKRGIIFNQLSIYADVGVPISYYRQLKSKLGYKYMGDTINVYYNNFKGEKDFGIPKEKIKVKSYII